MNANRTATEGVARPAAQERIADYKQSPFTLVYDGAITKNEPGKVNIYATPASCRWSTRSPRWG